MIEARTQPEVQFGPVAVWIASAVLGASLLWAYASTLTGMVERWSIDPRYSHGYLVPPFAVILLWLRRDLRPFQEPSRRVRWLGLAVLGMGIAIHLEGVHYYVNWFEAFGLLPMLAGIALLLGGCQGLHWAWPSIGFLVFMIPLPYRAEVAMGAPLQRAAALCSTCLLQMLGQPAVAEGNIIALRSTRLGVVEACNGLGMLVTFSAMTTALAMIVRRPWSDRVMIIIGAIPISFIANVSRITATGFLEETAGHRVAGVVYHDLAGWLMMPMALVLLWGELRLLSLLFIDPPGP